MNFNFIPYKLKEDISDFYINDIEYVDTDNAVDLYKAREGLDIQILGLGFRVINFYFYKRRLITIYFHLVDNLVSITECKTMLEKEIGTPSEIGIVDSGVLYYWNSDKETFGLISDKKTKKTYLYYSTSEHSIFK